MREQPQPLINSNFADRYLDRLTSWFGDKLTIMEDFDTICQSELDFIEILLLGEQEFAINLLENSKERMDFVRIKDFIGWAASHPGAPIYH